MAICNQCGMNCRSDRCYHPYAACLMYKACGNAETVEANLSAVEEHGAAAETDRLRLLLERCYAALDDRGLLLALERELGIAEVARGNMG